MCWVDTHGYQVRSCSDPLPHTAIGRDTEYEACQRFFRDGLTLSFNRILMDEAVLSWKPDIQVSSDNG